MHAQEHAATHCCKEGMSYTGACRGKTVRVISCLAVPEDAYAVDASYMGAPTVSVEKLDSSQAEAAATAVLKVSSIMPLMHMLAKDSE